MRGAVRRLLLRLGKDFGPVAAVENTAPSLGGAAGTGCIRDRPAIRLAVGAALGTLHAPRPLLSVFPMPISDRSGFRHCLRSVSVIHSNRRVRPRTHGGVAGSAGDCRPYADLVADWSKCWPALANRARYTKPRKSCTNWWITFRKPTLPRLGRSCVCWPIPCGSPSSARHSTMSRKPIKNRPRWKRPAERPGPAHRTRMCCASRAEPDLQLSCGELRKILNSPRTATAVALSGFRCNT